VVSPAHAGNFTDAVPLLNQALADLRGLPAKPAAQFLDGRGHPEAATVSTRSCGPGAGTRQPPGRLRGCPPHEFGNALAWRWTP